MSLQQWMEIAISVVMILQGFEQLALNKAFGPRGGWRWSTVRADFPENHFIDLLFGKLIPHPAFSYLRILAAFAICFFLTGVFRDFFLSPKSYC